MRAPRIIDAHHHLWDLDRVYYPWLTDEIVPDFLFGDYARIRKNYLPEDLRRQMRGWNVELTVHVEAERADGEQLKETAWLSEMYERFRLPNAIIGHVWLADPNVDELLSSAHAVSPLSRREIEAAHRQDGEGSQSEGAGHDERPAVASRPEAAGEARPDL